MYLLGPSLSEYISTFVSGQCDQIRRNFATLAKIQKAFVAILMKVYFDEDGWQTLVNSLKTKKTPSTVKLASKNRKKQAAQSDQESESDQ